MSFFHVERKSCGTNARWSCFNIKFIYVPIEKWYHDVLVAENEKRLNRRAEEKFSCIIGQNKFERRNTERLIRSDSKMITFEWRKHSGDNRDMKGIQFQFVCTTLWHTFRGISCCSAPLRRNLIRNINQFMCETNMDIIFRINNFYLHPASPVARSPFGLRFSATALCKTSFCLLWRLIIRFLESVKVESAGERLNQLECETDGSYNFSSAPTNLRLSWP